MAAALLPIGDLYRYYIGTEWDDGSFFEKALGSFKLAHDIALGLGFRQNPKDAMLVSFLAIRYKPDSCPVQREAFCRVVKQ